jgi:hypothetical protein
MKQIVSNIRYLWQHLSTWLKWFIIISFSLAYLVVAFGFGPSTAAGAVLGVTPIMLGIMAIGFLRFSSTLYFPIAIGATFLIANILQNLGVSSDWAEIIAAGVAGWGFIFYALSIYKPPS